VRNGRWSRPPSMRGRRARVWLPARRMNVVAEVVRRRLASNKLGKRAPKRAAGSSERGPSPRRKTAGQTVVRRRERKVRRGFGLTRVNGRAPDEDPGWRESAIQRSQHRPKGCGGRGTGAVTATGSREGSLPIEGIPDRRKRRLSRGGVEAGLGVTRIVRPAPTSPQERRAARKAAPGKLGEARR